MSGTSMAPQIRTEANDQQRALEEFSWYLQIARDMTSRHRELVDADKLPECFQSALDGTGGGSQIVAAIERWEELLTDSEVVPEQYRIEMKLLQDAVYRGTLAVTAALARSFRMTLSYQDDLRARLVRKVKQQSRSEEEDVSQWLSGEEAQASLQAAIKVAAHVQERGIYGTLADAKEALTADEFSSYEEMIHRLCGEGGSAKR